MGYQQKHEKRPYKVCIPLASAYRVHGNNYSACHFLVNRLERLHAVSLPLSLLSLKEKSKLLSWFVGDLPGHWAWFWWVNNSAL